MQDSERRARIMAAVTEPGAATGVGELIRRLCRFAVDEMALSGCRLVLMSNREGGSVLADAGPRARTITRLQAELGEGPCLQAYRSAGGRDHAPANPASASRRVAARPRPFKPSASKSGL
jgi:hypothetical protein